VTWSLRTRLTLSYVLMALLCVLMVSALANGVLESSFRRYARNAQVRNAQAVVVQVGAQVNSDGAWDQAGLTAVGMAALEQGMIIKLSTPDGAVVWDATVHNNGLCVQMLDHLAQNMASRYPNWRGSYTENLYPVRSGFRDIASLAIGYYGPFSFSDQDLAFINSLNLLLLWVTLAALVFAGGLGLFMARRITVPLERIALGTQRIAAGHRDVTITGTTKVRELDGIARTACISRRSKGG
jgi:two-component system sensor histidine kinase BaeS